MARVLFYVQHLLGIGHLIRAARICWALRNAGFEIHLVAGGNPVANLDLGGMTVIQLPPLKVVNGGFSCLVTEKGKPVTDEDKAHRARILREIFLSVRPDVLVTETFPFGRRQMRFELLPLLEAAKERRYRPLIISSVRDILQEGNRVERSREVVDLARRYFDHVIVHGDPRLISFGSTLPLVSEIEDLVCYSGLVAPAIDHSHSPAFVADVVVSAGGGAVGRKLIETAIASKSMTTMAHGRWLILSGPNVDSAWLDQLRARAADIGIALEHFVPDLVNVLGRARLSISQAGYNTVADVLVAGCKAVFVPFSGWGETEQARRARLLEEEGFGVVLPENKLSPQALATAIDRALNLPQPTLSIKLDGAAETAKILGRLNAEHHCA